MEDFKTVFKRKRKEEYTQQQFAEALGVSDTTVQNYENGELPPHNKLIEINRLLKYDFSRHIYQEKFGAEAAEEGFMQLYTDLKALLIKHSPSSCDPLENIESVSESQVLQRKYPEEPSEESLEQRKGKKGADRKNAVRKRGKVN